MIYAIIRSMVRLNGGTTGPDSRVPSIIGQLVNGDVDDSGFPGTGGGGGPIADGNPLGVFGRVGLAWTYEVA